MARVLLHSLVFSPDAVSTAYLMTDLAVGLRRLGHDVVVLTTTPHYNIDCAALHRQPMEKRWMGLLARSSYEGVTVWHVRIPMKGGRVLTRMLDYIYFHLLSIFVGLTLLRPYDIVLTPSPPLTIGVVGWLLGWQRRVPFVYNVQELYPDFAVHQGIISNTLFIRILKSLERFVYTKSARIVAISEWFKKIIVARNVPAAKVVVIPNFVDTELFRPIPRHNTFAERHGLVSDFVVLYGGNIGLSQDWESLLYSATTVVHLPIRFIIVGGGAMEQWLAREIESRQLTNITMLGYQSRETMAEVNASSDLCVIPMKATTTTDTFPSKIYTILACSKSVLVQADADSELHWLVTEQRCGRVVPPGDQMAFANAILDAYHHQEDLLAEGERGRLFVQQRYSKESVAVQYDQLIKELVQK